MNKAANPKQTQNSAWTSSDSGFTMNGTITNHRIAPVKTNAHRSIMFASLALGMMMPFSAMAQSTPDAVQVDGYCDPAVINVLVKQYEAQQNDADETMNDLFKTIKDVSNESFEKMSACVDMSWPNISFQRPTMDQIIKGVAQAAVRKVCGEARSIINQANSGWNNSYYMNTRIPGVPSYGVSMRGTRGGSGGNITVNGTPVSTPGGLYNPPSPPARP